MKSNKRIRYDLYVAAFLLTFTVFMSFDWMLGKLISREWWEFAKILNVLSALVFWSYLVFDLGREFGNLEQLKPEARDELMGRLLRPFGIETRKT